MSDGITWPAAAIPTAGHYCFVAVAGDAADPKPGLTSFTTFDEYLHFIENNNNVAWRNFNSWPGRPRPEPPGFYRLPFVVPGAFDTSHTFVLETIGGYLRGVAFSSKSRGGWPTFCGLIPARSK